MTITGNHLGALAGIPRITGRVIAAIDESWAAVRRELEHVPLSFWNESVYRFYFIRELFRLRPDVRCQVEWRRFDLLIQDQGENAIVEFKFYVYAMATSLDGGRTRRKGGPGGKNFLEFSKCLRRLDSVEGNPRLGAEAPKIHGRFLILVFADDENYKGRSYADWYSNVLSLPKGVLKTHCLNELHRLPAIRCKQTGHQLRARLFALEPPTVKRMNMFALDRSAFATADLEDEGDEREYWLRRTPLERLRAVEHLRENAYGQAATRSGLQRVFETAERLQC